MPRGCQGGIYGRHAATGVHHARACPQGLLVGGGYGTAPLVARPLPESPGRRGAAGPMERSRFGRRSRPRCWRLLDSEVVVVIGGSACPRAVLEKFENVYKVEVQKDTNTL